MNDEISLKELLETTFTINENDELVGTYTLTRINIISNILINLQQENERLNNIINELEKWLNENNLYKTNDNILVKLKELENKREEDE